MQRHHKRILAIGVVLLLAGWFAWSVLLTESEEPAPVEQKG
jgi:hypothetical protein